MRDEHNCEHSGLGESRLVASRGSACLSLARTARLSAFHGPRGPLDSEVQALDWFSGLFPSCATQQSREDEVAVTDPVNDREPAADGPQSTGQLRHVYLLHRDEAVVGRAGYGALQVAVQRVAAPEARLTRPERCGESR